MISDALKLFRKFHGFKSVEMAKALGISQSYLSEIENGRKRPSIDLIEKYAEIFQTKPSVILFFSEKIDEGESPNALRSFLQQKLIKIISSIEKAT